MKEKILELIIENDGLSYKKLLEKCEGLKRKSGYKYLQRLKEDRLIISINDDNIIGKSAFYKPTLKALNQESKQTKEELEQIADNLVNLMVKARLNSADYDVNISEKEISPSIKRLRESGKLG